MPDVKIEIENCNNIIKGEINIIHNKLNILFGRNGTGKSTIAQAIDIKSKGKDLSKLAPFGINNQESLSKVEGLLFNKILIFDNDYVQQYVYQPDTLIKDTFEVLIRSKEYDDAKQNIDSALSVIKSTITNREEIITLRQHIGSLIENIEFTGSTNKLAKRKGGIKGVLNGKGAYFNPPAELNELRPFFDEEMVSKWADWRLHGYTNYGSKGCCPYCSTGDNERTNIINKIFIDSFDKASVEYAAAISKAIEALQNYLNMDKAKELLSLFGIKENISVLEAQITKLGAEARYLHDRLTEIVSFNGSSVDRENIADLESKLKNMKIDPRVCEIFFVSELIKTEINNVNIEIDNILDKVNVLKGEIGKYNKYIQEKINDRRSDINEFLNIAGFKYTFDVEINGENNARALLKFVLPDGNPGDIKSPGKHLSWGEKHAFALILFMFDAIRCDADLIILDDPISSFDSNKKYAIINRLFKTGDKENSFYQRTVLMLTHDFEPVIDYIQVGSGRQDQTTVCANFLENNKGQLQCTQIQKNNDLMSSIVLLKELAKDESIDIAARIGCLRKFIEHQYKKPRDESNAYNILSSLIHGRREPTVDNDGIEILENTQISNGILFIKEYIQNFDYNSMLVLFQKSALLDRYLNESSQYIKMLILRAYTEQDKEARERLRINNDALRKYVDETYHIENDYLYSLDIRRFNIVPDYYINEADIFVKNERKRNI